MINQFGIVKLGPLWFVLVCAAPFLASTWHPQASLEVGQRRSMRVNSSRFGAMILDHPLLPVSLDEPVNCDDVLLYLDDAVGRAKDLKDTYLIIVGRLGKGETSRRLNQMRLLAIESYIKRKGASKYLTAEGNRTEGLGRIELYVGGRLLHLMPITKNAKTFCATPVG